ncbi:ABC transporter substrate-binding protein [Streptomyces olivaceoviridis]|nr:ABC transporter substrate-binding protein [Streptomyces olivaceoviridis]
MAQDFRLPASRTWTRAKKRGYFVVGAKEDQPYLAERDPATGACSGFDIDIEIEIARMMSASLGFPPKTVRFRTIASANRETALQNGQIDYYVGTYTVNAGRKELVGFAGPYYLAGQSLLVREEEDDIHGPQDLTTDDAILIGYAAKTPDELEAVGAPFSEEPYGIGVPHGDNALRFALDDALATRESNGDCKKAYDATPGRSGVPAPRPPAIDR